MSPTLFYSHTTYFGLLSFLMTHSSVLAWRIPGTGEPGGLPSMGSRRVGHDWSDLAVAAAFLMYNLPLEHWEVLLLTSSIQLLNCSIPVYMSGSIKITYILMRISFTSTQCLYNGLFCLLSYRLHSFPNLLRSSFPLHLPPLAVSLFSIFVIVTFISYIHGTISLITFYMPPRDTQTSDTGFFFFFFLMCIQWGSLFML